MKVRRLSKVFFLLVFGAFQANAQFVGGAPNVTQLQNINDRVGIGVTTPNAVSKVDITSPSTITYGSERAVYAHNLFAGTNISGLAESSISGGGAWSAAGSMYGIATHAGNVTTLRAPFANRTAYAVGGAFTATASNLNSTVVSGAAVRLAGSWSRLNGNLSSFPALADDAIAAAVIAEDNINTTDTYAGYFKGKGRFTDRVTIGTGSLSSGNLMVGNSNGNGIGVFAQNYGVASEGYRTGVSGVAGAHFSPGWTIVSETVGVWGISGGVSNVNSVGVHGDGIGSQYGIGVWGSGISGSIATYGILGDATGGFSGWAGYFNGNVHATGTVTWSSDAKLKKNVKPIENAMELLSALSPKEYEYKTEEFPQLGLSEGKNYGLIAQELERVFPDMTQDIIAPPKYDEEGEMVHDKTEFKGVNYVALIPVLIKGLQEQSEIVQTQTEMIEAQNARIEALERALLGGDRSGVQQDELAPQLPAGFGLKQNQPNPFSDQTTISLNIPERVGDAQLLVFDLKGKQLKEFSIDERGQTEVAISIPELGSGMYLYSLVADGKVVGTKRMILSK